jgi:hypothetical protein
MDTIPAAAAAPAPAAAVLQPQASHGQGARSPSCAPCHACHQRRPLTWIFAQGFCEGCRAEPACRKNFLSLRQASRRFGLDGSDLAHTDRQPVQNPVHRNFPPMRALAASSQAARRCSTLKTARARREAVAAARKARNSRAARTSWRLCRGRPRGSRWRAGEMARKCFFEQGAGEVFFSEKIGGGVKRS